MYERESNQRTESSDQIPVEILARFEKPSARTVARTMLPWAEHCTECAIPHCYQTCDLYEARVDGKCRRFTDGIVGIQNPDGLSPVLLKIRFKQWGKLFAYGNAKTHSLDQVRAAERSDARIAGILNGLPAPERIRKTLIRLRYDQKNRRVRTAAGSANALTHFVFECYNPQPQTIRLSMSVLPLDLQERDGTHFQTLIHVKPGYNTTRIPVPEILQFVDLSSPYKIELIPNDVPDGTTLVFGMLDFVRESGVPTASESESEDHEPASPRCKCVVWDLDNTLWHGILVEDGADALTLVDGVVDVIKALDARGILQSIASKNNADEALAVLRRFGIEEFFLHPQISWGPKSEAMSQIADKLNIGMDTLVFVDDSSFERAEVGENCRDVRVIDAALFRRLPDDPMFDVPVTDESRSRRRMYREQATRETIRVSAGTDYNAFLRDCNIRVIVSPLSATDIDRVHELTQRTNQLNFSGNRYDRSVLEKILADGKPDAWVLRCEDRFGTYGTIGFCLVEAGTPIMTDLMFSCRVQSKRVEHAVLTFLLNHYRGDPPRDFHANYRQTPRNAPAGKVFDDFGFERRGDSDGIACLVLPADRAILDDGLICVVHSAAEIA